MEVVQNCFDFRITGTDLFVAEVVELERLGQCKDMVVLKVPIQSIADGLYRLLAVAITVVGESRGVALTSESGQLI